MKPRLLANENFPAPSIRLLRDRDYDVAAIAEGARSLFEPCADSRDVRLLALKIFLRRLIGEVRVIAPRLGGEEFPAPP